MNVYQLIDLIEPYPALYDTKNAQYSNVSHKQYLWEVFGQQLGQEPKSVKRKWDKLRSQFRRELSQLKTKGRTPTWHLYNRLAFLEPHTKPYEMPEVTMYPNYSAYPTTQPLTHNLHTQQSSSATMLQNIANSSQVSNLEEADAQLFRNFFELFGSINKLTVEQKKKQLTSANRMLTNMSKQVSKMAKRRK